MQSHSLVNEGTGLLLMNKITPVIEALFGLYHLQKIKKKKTSFYISRRPHRDYPTWPVIIQRLHKNLERTPLVPFDPQSLSAKDYLNDLCTQLDKHENYSRKQVYYLFDVCEEINENGRVEFEHLFKMALAFDDGHGLTGLHYKSAWYNNNNPFLFDFYGDGVYATKDAVFSIDVNSDIDFAKKLSPALAKKDAYKASDYMCAHICQRLSKVSDHDLRKEIIKQISKNITQAAALAFNSLDIGGKSDE